MPCFEGAGQVANSCWDCVPVFWWNPVELAACLTECCHGNEYELHPHTMDPSAGLDCQRSWITEDPVETMPNLDNQASSWNVAAGCTPFDASIVVDYQEVSEVTVGMRSFFGAATLESIANEIAAGFVSFTAPSMLIQDWPQFLGYFDDPEFEWIYLRASYDPDYSRCVPPATVNSSLYQRWNHAHLVSALRPYCAYATNTSEEDSYTHVRVRIWVGLMHHFSYFLPTSFTDLGPYQIANIPVVWSNSPSPGLVSQRGTFADFWLKQLESLYCGVWAERGFGRGELYDCDPSRVSNASTSSRYANSTGAPTRFCFSNQAAFTDSSTEMTSFLGESLWGEVCFNVLTHDLDLRALAEEAFETLFGRHVKLGYRATFWYAGNNPNSPYVVERYLCRAAADLEPVEALVARGEAKRNTSQGRWLYREWDLNRLTASAQEFAGRDPCACNP